MILKIFTKLNDSMILITVKVNYQLHKVVRRLADKAFLRVTFTQV